MISRGGVKYESGSYDLVPEGVYVVTYFGDEQPVWIRAYGRHVTIFLFTIVEGDYAGLLLPWWVSVEKTPRGTFRFPNGGQYLKLLRSAGCAPKRRDRCQPNVSLKGLKFIADVANVTKNIKGELLPKDAIYSKILTMSPNGQAKSPKALI